MRIVVFTCLCLGLASCTQPNQPAQSQHEVKERKPSDFEYKVVRFTPIEKGEKEEKYMTPDEVIPNYEKKIVDLANSGWEYVGLLSGGDNSTKNRGYWNDTFSRYVLFRRIRE